MQLSLRDAARALGVDESTLLRWVRRREIKAQQVHDAYRFDHVDVLELAAARGIHVPPDLLGEIGARTQALPRLADAIRAGGVARDVAATDKESALRAVVERLPAPPGVDREFLFQMLMAREKAGSTGLGDGIAIPHPRHPIVLRVGQPTVSVCHLAAPVPFDALDGRPVRTLFTMIAPSVRIHLHLLSVLAGALRDPEVRARVEARADAPELTAAVARFEEALAARREGSR